MKQSAVRRTGAGFIAFILLCALAFGPLCEASAQEPESTQLAAAQSLAAELTTESVAAAGTSKVTAQDAAPVSYAGMRVVKQAQVQGEDWSGWFSKSTVGNVDGAGLSAFGLKLKGKKNAAALSGHIRYRVYERGAGWTRSVADGKRIVAQADIEAIAVKLAGSVASQYDVMYRAYMSGSGWLPWVRNNAKSGLVRKGQRVLAFQVKLAPKTEEAFGATVRAAGILYQARTAAAGWYAWRRDGATMGKRGLKIAGLVVKADAGSLSGGVKYSVYSKGGGWTQYVKDGAYAKTSNGRLEAFRVKLTGKMAKTYDVYYRARVQNVGWLDWAKNGATAGNIGYGLRCEAFQVVLVKKGAAAPGETRYPTVNKMETVLSMNGIDISSWQAGIDLYNTDSDFVIIKATGGVSYVNSYYATWADAVLASGKQLGFYHYAREASCPGTAVQEATHFVNAVGPYVGKAILVLDFEGGALEMSNSVKWAKKFMDTVYKKTGVKPLLYMSQSVTWRFDWSSVAKKYKLWVAQYLYRNFNTGYLEAPEGGTDLGYWPSAQIYQYSSTGGVSGYDGYLDLDKFYGSVLTWKQLARKN